MGLQFQLIEGSRELLIAAVCRGVHAVSTNDIGVSGPGKPPEVVSSLSHYLTRSAVIHRHKTTTRSAPTVAPDLSRQQLKAFGRCRGWGCRRWQVFQNWHSLRRSCAVQVIEDGGRDSDDNGVGHAVGEGPFITQYEAAHLFHYRAIRTDCPVPFKIPVHVYCARRRHLDPGPEREQNGHHKVCWWNYHRKLRDTFGTVRQRRESAK